MNIHIQCDLVHFGIDRLSELPYSFHNVRILKKYYIVVVSLET